MRGSTPARPIALMLLAALLSVCGLTAQGAGIDVNPAVTADGDMINDRLSLRAYPGATLVRQEQDDDESESAFDTRASLEAVFDHLDRQLGSQGWRRGDLEFRPNKVEAEYRRRGDEIALELSRHRNSGRYTLEIEYSEDEDDDDDADDDDDD